MEAHLAQSEIPTMESDQLVDTAAQEAAQEASQEAAPEPNPEAEEVPAVECS